MENFLQSMIFLNEGVFGEPTEYFLKWIFRIVAVFGSFIFIYIAFGIINMIFNKKKNKEIERTNKKLEDIENLLKKLIEKIEVKK